MNRMNLLAAGAAGVLVGLLAWGGPAREGSDGPAPATGEVADAGVVITNARIFDGERILSADSLRMREGLIVEVGEGLEAGDGESSVDARGGTLLPGLIDAHTHSWGEARADALRFGVTTVVDMFTMASMLPEARESREAFGPTRQADLFSAGTLATVEGGHGTQFGLPVPTVDSDDEVVPWVRARREEGSDFIKIVREDLSAYRGRPDLPSLEAPRAAALVEAAHDEGLKAVVHVAAYRHAVESLDAGADGLVHVFQDTLADDAFARRAAGEGLFVVPTLTVVSGLSGERSALAEDARLGPRLSGGQKQTLSTRWPFSSNPELIANARANVAKLHAAGVRILAGTDAPNANTAHGASLHEELAQLVDAGLSPLEALAAATAHPAEAFGLGNRGRIAAGMRADLVLVEGRPDQQILDTRGIRAIWKNGHPVAMDARQAEAAPALGAGPAEGFDSGRWVVSTDREVGGGSEARLEVGDGALRVTGSTVAPASAGMPAWAGATYFPASEPIAPVDASALSGLRLRMRGEPRPYALVLISGEADGSPAFHPVQVGEDWTEVTVRWEDVAGLDPAWLRAVAITAGQPWGGFAFEVASMEFVP